MEIDGWDISNLNLYESMKRAAVFDYNLQEKLREFMEPMKPRKAVFFQDFVAANQAERADNVLTSGSKWEQMEQLRADIRDFKETKNLEKIIVMWVGNTERFSEIVEGLNDTWDNLERSMKVSAHEISPSTVYAAAAILEGVRFLQSIQLHQNSIFIILIKKFLYVQFLIYSYAVCFYQWLSTKRIGTWDSGSG